MKDIERALNCRGLTFVELLFSSTILMILMYAVTSMFNMAGRTYQQSQVESELYAEAVYVMDMIQRGESGLFGIMKGRSNTVVIDPDSRGVSFSVDKNIQYTADTDDDIMMSIVFDNGDGDDNTLEDNIVVIDRNTADADDEVIEIGRNIEDLAFNENGGIVSVTLTIAKDTRGGLKRVSFSRDIMMRN